MKKYILVIDEEPKWWTEIELDIYVRNIIRRNMVFVQWRVITKKKKDTRIM